MSGQYSLLSDPTDSSRRHRPAKAEGLAGALDDAEELLLLHNLAAQDIVDIHACQLDLEVVLELLHAAIQLLSVAVHNALLTSRAGRLTATSSSSTVAGALSVAMMQSSHVRDVIAV